MTGLINMILHIKRLQLEQTIRDRISDAHLTTDETVEMFGNVLSNFLLDSQTEALKQSIMENNFEKNIACYKLACQIMDNVKAKALVRYCRLNPTSNEMTYDG